MPRRKNNYYDGSYFPRTERIRTEEGIKAHSQHGQIGQSWWAKRWLAALERIIDKGRLQRGRSYARSGQVLSIEEKQGTILARVQGSRPTPYKVTIDLAPLSAAQWEAAITRMAGEALFAAQLLAGEMPAEIEEVFAAGQGQSLQAYRSRVLHPGRAV